MEDDINAIYPQALTMVSIECCADGTTDLARRTSPS